MLRQRVAYEWDVCLDPGKTFDWMRHFLCGLAERYVRRICCYRSIDRVDSVLAETARKDYTTNRQM